MWNSSGAGGGGGEGGGGGGGGAAEKELADAEAEKEADLLDDEARLIAETSRDDEYEKYESRILRADQPASGRSIQ